MTFRSGDEDTDLCFCSRFPDFDLKLLTPAAGLGDADDARAALPPAPPALPLDFFFGAGSGDSDDIRVACSAGDSDRERSRFLAEEEPLALRCFLVAGGVVERCFRPRVFFTSGDDDVAWRPRDVLATTTSGDSLSLAAAVFCLLLFTEEPLLLALDRCCCCGGSVFGASLSDPELDEASRFFIFTYGKIRCESMGMSSQYR